MAYEICCIGHITLDKVVTPKATVFMPGGTSFYFSNAIASMNVRYALVTALAANDLQTVADLRERNIEVKLLLSKHTLFFENIYTENSDHRTQRVLQTADPFTVEQLADVEADIFHLGPLLAGDMPEALIKSLARRGKVSLDAQGFLRKVDNYNVHAIDWAAKRDTLPYVHYLKVNEYEMEALTGETNAYEGAKILSAWGVKEVIITLGSNGSLIYNEGTYYTIPAYQPTSVEDATGCGDTYMAGYLSQRIKGAAIQQAGEFAAAMATLKIEASGPFTGTAEDVCRLLLCEERAFVNV